MDTDEAAAEEGAEALSDSQRRFAEQLDELRGADSAN